MGTYCFLATGIIVLFTSFSWAQDSNTESSPSTTEATQVEVPTSTESSPKERVERVEVTGSYIRRTDVEGPSPVVTIDRQQIEASGFNDVGQLLRADTSSPFGGDGETVSLRGLGTDRTLVLINGQRAPRNASSYNAQGSSVNIVPLAAVERIEILKDGASATYGSEAIGGVINIITRKNLDGIIFTTKYDMTEPNGGDTSRSSIAYAKNSDRSSLLISLQYEHVQGNRISDFDFRQGTLNRSTFAPNYEANNQFLAAPNCPTGSVNASSGACLTDISPLFGSLPENEWGSVVNYTYDIDSDTQFYTTFIGRYEQDNGRRGGTTLQVPGADPGIPFTGADATTLGGLPVTSGLDPSAYTAGDDIRLFAQFPMNQSTKSEEYTGGLIVGTKGYWGNSDWSWDASLNNQIFVDHNRFQNWGVYEPTRAAILAGTYNPFSTTTQDVSSLVTEANGRDRYQVNWANFVSSGELGDAIGANWSTAVGISAAHFEYREDSDDRAVNTQLMGLVGADAGGERQLYAGYAELSGLFGQTFETQLALRFDQYSDFGNTLNPKLAFRYQPMKSLTLRSSFGTGFNAPSLQQAYGPNLEFFLNGLDDPVGCAAVGNDPNNENCQPLSVSGQRATNPDLQEETSTNFNFGVIYEPIKYLTFGFDYWRVKVENVIFGGDPQKLLELEEQGVDISRYNAITTRDPLTQRLERITLGLSNAGTREVDGLDGNINYLLKTHAGDFTFGTTFSYLFHYKESFYDELGNEEVLGQGGLPRWRNVGTFGYKRGWFTGQFISRTTSEVERQARSLARIPQFTQYDVNFDFSVGKDSTLTVGAINVFDQQPKLDPSEGTIINGDLYRPVRITYLGYRQSF